MVKFYDVARIKFHLGQSGYRKLIFNWFYDWHEDWDKFDMDWRNKELKRLLENR